MLLKTLLWIMLLLCAPTFGQPTVAFFYGAHIPIPELCLYDILVVDPQSNFNPQNQCNAMNQPLAYVSLGEIPNHVMYKEGIQSAWIIGRNKAWDSNPILDQTNRAWQTFFLEQIIAPLWEKGYRGFFLDTLDSYLLVSQDPTFQEKQIAGIVQMIQQIKQRYPDAKIILNRGFRLLPQVKNEITAVAIESLYQGWNQLKHQYEPSAKADQTALFNEIAKLKQMQKPIIIIDYLPPSQQHKAQVLANQIANQGLIPWITDKDVQQIYLKKLRPVPRKILVIQSAINQSIIRNAGALPKIGIVLEHLGYVPEYVDLATQPMLPQATPSQQYAGIIIWLEAEEQKNKLLFDWLQKQMAAKIPVVFINRFIMPTDAPELKRLGLSIAFDKTTTKSLSISKLDKNYVGYETTPSITPYDFFSLKTNDSKVLLQLKNDQRQTQDAVAITPWGGYALQPYVLQYLPNTDYALWIINPFHFLHDALRLTDLPTPDTTTENGSRLMSVHVDGDGFSDQAKWVGGGLAAAELRDKVLKRFQIPTSVSVVTGEVAPNGVNPNLSPQLINLARSIFNLPWVEIASHTFSHPIFWQPELQHMANSDGEPDNLTLPHYQFNLPSEITNSVNFINQYLAPANKKCRLFFWSGLADPPLATLKLAYQQGLLNINGVNGTHIDNNHPSLTGVKPMAAKFGDYYQVFAPIDFDFYYMNGLGGPLYGFERVIQTLQITDKPRRLKPIDIYYHFYSASYPAALQALIKVYQWALKQPVMNIYISEYIKKVLDYYQITINRYQDAWVIYSKGQLREIRSLNQMGYPDLTKSQNVLGFQQNKDDKYIHLGPDRLTILHYQLQKPTEPYLIQANARVVSFARTTTDFTIKFKGYMPLKFTMANMTGCQITSKSSLHTLSNSDLTMTYLSNKVEDEIHIHC